VFPHTAPHWSLLLARPPQLPPLTFRSWTRSWAPMKIRMRRSRRFISACPLPAYFRSPLPLYLLECASPVVWTSLGPLPRWVPGPTTRWAPGTTRLALHGTWRCGAQELHKSSTRLGSCTCSALYGGLLDVLD
jgi:hypothetical protein